MALEKSTTRRLLLAKQLFLHGLDHSHRLNPLDKMVAIHNFHNALEITLRAIMLDFEIRAEKQLNIEFETMLSEIGQSDAVKNRGLKLSYRQELRNLNNLRNMVQHHGVEPEASTMEDWRVFTGRFLKGTFHEFFGVNFDELTTIEFISDPDLKALLNRSKHFLEEHRWIDSILFSKVAFEAASASLHDFLPSEGFNSSFFVTSGLRHDGLDMHSLQREIESIFKRIRKAELFSAVISSGVPVADYKRLEGRSPNVVFTIGGNPVAQSRNPDEYDTEEDARWAFNLCCDAILNWQTMGMQPTVKLLNKEGLRKWAAEYGTEQQRRGDAEKPRPSR